MHASALIARFLRLRRPDPPSKIENIADGALFSSLFELSPPPVDPPTIVKPVPPAKAPGPIASGVPKLSLMAHVSNLGDRQADPLGWVGDPAPGCHIEGFRLHSDVPEWPSICTCQAVLPDGKLDDPVPGGSFCGTHGKALPLHGFLVTVPRDQIALENIVYEGRFQDGFHSPPVRLGEVCRSPALAALIAMRISMATPTPAATQIKPGTAAKIDPKAVPDPELAQLALRHKGVNFLAPVDLCRHPPLLRRVALVGSCFLQGWNLHGRHATSCAFDVFTVNNAAKLPDLPSAEFPLSDYDFQIVQIAMRSFFHDDMLTRLAYADIAAHEAAFEAAAKRMAFQLSCSLKWNLAHGLLTFVTNFPAPQRNPFGVLFPRYDIRNPEHFVYLLNERLERLVRAYENAYILDVDRISTSFGRRFIQDDIVSTFSHNSILGTPGPNRDRMEPMASMIDHYDVVWGQFLPAAIWEEALLMYRVVRQDDAVKIVIVDLDDTLWQGISGEMEHVDASMLAGWPEGLTEALLYLKKRGILLAIVSKNDEQRIRAIWPKIFGRKLSLDDFSVVRINWQPKAENIADVLSLTSLLPRSAVFIDDNPAERAAVLAAFPDIRVLGRYPYYLRRILLWSAETQNIAISEESGRRTEMVQAQLLREETRTNLSREDFLRTARPEVSIGWMRSTDHPRFARAFELINKTNQFNTTGKRWTAEEMRAFLSSGGLALLFDVTDAFTAYGLVGVILLRERSIEQWVMSCRVLGLDIEIAVMEQVVLWIKAKNPGIVNGVLVPTDANFPCRDLFQKCNFSSDGVSWTFSHTASLPKAAHISITWPDKTPTAM